MKLIKLTKGDQTRYYSSQTFAAKALNGAQTGVRAAIYMGNKVYGWNAEYCEDEVLTTEVDKYFDLEVNKRR